jgi:single-strand DNA-binding protein
MPRSAATDQLPCHRNEVVLVGRLSAPAEVRSLPSGDELVSWRVVVARPRSPGGRRGAAVDTLDCAAATAAAARAATRWLAGDVVELHGSLHRRFWQSPAGPASRYQVAVTRGRRLGSHPGP